MVRYDQGPFEPLEKRLGSREAFEAFQRSEAERTARYHAHHRKQRREMLFGLVKLIVGLGLIVLAVYVAYKLAAGEPIF